MAEHRAEGAVDVLDGDVALDGDSLVDGGPALLDQLVVENVFQPVVLRPRAIDLDIRVGLRGGSQDGRKVEAAGLPMVDPVVHFEQIAAADHFIDRAEAELGHDLSALFGDEEEVIDHVLGLAGEFLSQLRVLSGHAHGASVEMALAHHDAAERDQRGRRESELFGPQHAGDHDVAARLQLAVGLQADAAAQIVEDQGLVRLGDAQLPGNAGVLDARQAGRRPSRRYRRK